MRLAVRGLVTGDQAQQVTVVDGRAGMCLQVQLAALGLLAQPLAIITQVFKLPAQTLGQRRQARRQGLRLAAAVTEVRLIGALRPRRTAETSGRPFVR